MSSTEPTHYLVTTTHQAIGVVATDKDDARRQGREMGLGAIILRVDAAISEAQWNARTTVRSTASAELAMRATGQQAQSAGRYAKAQRHLLSEAHPDYAHISHAPEHQRAAADSAECARDYLFALIGGDAS